MTSKRRGQRTPRPSVPKGSASVEQAPKNHIRTCHTSVCPTRGSRPFMICCRRRGSCATSRTKLAIRPARACVTAAMWTTIARSRIWVPDPMHHMMRQAPPAPIRSRMPLCSGRSRPSPSAGREDAAGLDRPRGRRLRNSAVGRVLAAPVEPNKILQSMTQMRSALQWASIWRSAASCGRLGSLS
jgi:hypothetical protein